MGIDHNAQCDQALRMMPEMIGTHRNGLFRANRSQCSSYQAFLVPDMSQIKGLELLVVAAGLSRMKELIESNAISRVAEVRTLKTMEAADWLGFPQERSVVQNQYRHLLTLGVEAPRWGSMKHGRPAFSSLSKQSALTRLNSQAS
ncbi:uncharacterized protein BO96DRAFT_437022 [Aspergillus niger CBS 101883]|uniref:Uncharacterized protein n=2 Tax=Aspergillus niger TaxID=5061 RepID=A2QP55_ASPNC|nr:uncharacterized protein BO96DRAFT_437022 [Aspergillus niger CBS 101883]XP_059605400.1 hypothetical protein An07g08260 [Aspergillus niger]PYH53393.1 hypothetical protein BO96DRAFT_437022 [Aspergillus niger CBS 101883]CAK48208.1 hypothetical protein An07g08260 [Aspergillus niger]